MMNEKRMGLLEALVFEPGNDTFLQELNATPNDEEQLWEHVYFDSILSCLPGETRVEAGYKLRHEGLVGALLEQGRVLEACHYIEGLDVPMGLRTRTLEQLRQVELEGQPWETRSRVRRVCGFERSWWCPSMRLEGLRDKLRSVGILFHLRPSDISRACFGLTLWETGVPTAGNLDPPDYGWNMSALEIAVVGPGTAQIDMAYLMERSGARGAHWVDTMNKPEVLPKVDVAFVMDWCDEMAAQKMREVGAEVIMVNSSDANSLRSAWLRSRLSA